MLKDKRGKQDLEKETHVKMQIRSLSQTNGF